MTTQIVKNCRAGRSVAKEILEGNHDQVLSEAENETLKDIYVRFYVHSTFEGKFLKEEISHFEVKEHKTVKNFRLFIVLKDQNEVTEDGMLKISIRNFTNCRQVYLKSETLKKKYMKRLMRDAILDQVSTFKTTKLQNHMNVCAHCPSDNNKHEAENLFVDYSSPNFDRLCELAMTKEFPRKYQNTTVKYTWRNLYWGFLCSDTHYYCAVKKLNNGTEISSPFMELWKKYHAKKSNLKLLCGECYANCHSSAQCVASSATFTVPADDKHSTGTVATTGTATSTAVKVEVEENGSDAAADTAGVEL